MSIFISVTNSDNVEDGVTDLLEKEGYTVVRGNAAVKAEIKRVAVVSSDKLCSGYKVFPDGKRCSGCIDCNGES